MPASRREVFELLADPHLLDRLTPPWFRLEPRGEVPRELDTGDEISYRLGWRGLPFDWTSLLTDWRAPDYFAYEQKKGPYHFFRHEHFFRSVDGGTEIRDYVYFRAPGGLPVDRLIALPDLRRIFAFRERRALPLLRALQEGVETAPGARRIPWTSASISTREQPTVGRIDPPATQPPGLGTADKENRSPIS
jgi:ligand-binding SRPBCC domain-containing protein